MFDDKCSNSGLAAPISTDGAKDFYGIDGCTDSYQNCCIAYVDDIFRPFLCPAKNIIDAVEVLTKIVHSTFTFHGFSPNFKPGKTEAVILFCGPNTRHVKHDIYNVRSCVVSVRCHGDVTHDVRIVD
eukprot:11993643-Karenia_brevis.AAC.1